MIKLIHSNPHFKYMETEFLYLTVILRGRAGYELIYITNEAVVLVN